MVLDSMQVQGLATARGAGLNSDVGYRLLAGSEGWIPSYGHFTYLKEVP
jgi:hypothetical protein